ncbi:peptidyl-dipeptidase Dcp [Xanthomonas graminis]|jgi:peptidyl-dipeptidase Dcp|uniref:Dipeptidyl carboxypeptidase n=1 Tax=Xanthomonas graminis pv. graminis TaxID=134874 RepID=A0A1M4I9D4_9XANT|nr:peptidyl-dipeptidase Dcp [Xanthomonas translucens]EKU26702.1 peptidyl-dipeptidase [Xanthomonas translucens pv. graminis ART-Xtg29]OAX61566.1 dipeptidyl carboxypeptidase [Xanthomonas translucens pv. graminis]UKE54553.1 peptidyl-dipeptidase Dcp [Xanthomonas translucens pv. graminis]WIH08971.1 peptidyl-dipeptidase Dcp [Xanthomonas translucens pv. graminis]WIH12465.1 peptidyl-dipeptidase Dcp [Xanthomonas translucens pv. graminis]
MSRTVVLAAAISLALAACSGKESTPVSTAPAAQSPAPAAANPLLSASTLPFQAPPFDKIKDADYQPAFEEGMKQHLAEIRKIADNAEPATFANTIEAMERSGETLTRVQRIFFGLVQADTNDARQKIQEAVAPKLAEHQDEISLDPKLFARIKAIYDQRDTLNLEPEQKRLVERDYEEFVRAGAQLSDADKATLRKLNVEETTLATQFHTKLVAASAAGAVVVDDKAKLDGLSDGDIASAAQDAAARKLDGKYLLALQNTTQQPVLASLKDRALRTQVMAASQSRAEKGDANDTRQTIQRLAQLRAQKAKLLGFESYAAYSLGDQMAKTPAAALKLLTDTVPAATAKARSEVAEMQKVIDAQKGGFKLAASDWDFYAEQVRKAKYDLDESQIKPYFELDNVLKNGVFYAATELYGITFKERTDIPTYNPDMKVYEVFDQDGTSMALFYTDYYKRDSKSGGAWMDVFVGQDGLTGAKPVVYNVCNFTKPAPGQPALLSFDDVTTMFHEFGHALHGMFSKVKYPSIAGTSTSRDFVEFPSQFNEHWASDPKVFAHYAKHYQTGAAMPAELVEKIKKARTFNQGYATTEYLSAALLDLAWHTQPADAPLQDVDKFEADALKKFKVDLAEVPPRYRTTYFDHIWGGGYSAGYYAYFWSEVLDDDAFEWFKENGGLSRKNGDIFRAKILSRGNTVDLATLYRDFRGKDPSVEPLLENRGLKN